jgi:hypothetical protein
VWMPYAILAIAGLIGLGLFSLLVKHPLIAIPAWIGVYWLYRWFRARRLSAQKASTRKTGGLDEKLSLNHYQAQQTSSH